MSESQTLVAKLIASRLVGGRMAAGEEIALAVDQDDTIRTESLREHIAGDEHLSLALPGNRSVAVRHALSPRQTEILLIGGLINWLRRKRPTEPQRTQQDKRQDAAA